MKTVGICIGSIVGVLVMSFIFGLYGLGWMKFFGPKKENIRRDIFEQTQSYVHGKIQDLAKYQDEYNKADENGKEAIRQIILLRFAEFDETKIRAINLRNYLITMRGY